MIDQDILTKLPSPVWLLDKALLEKNIDILDTIQQRSGAKILLALKGYALWRSFDTIRDRLHGCCASGLWEAKLAYEEFGREVHTYSPAFRDSEIDEIATISNHIVFNTPQQFKKYAKRVKDINPKLSLGLRINPQYSESPVEIYNPCGLYSRLGTTLDNFDESILDSCDGFHFHALCEQSADALESVLDIFEEKFSNYLYTLKWINFGGGHHVTRDGYDIEKLISLVEKFKSSYIRYISRGTHARYHHHAISCQGKRC